MQQIKSLLWNEWRQKRTTIIFLSLLTIVLWGGIFLLFKLKVKDDIISMLLTGTLIGLPVLYCVILGNSPAMEFERKTAPFLQGLPIPPGTIYWAKYLFSLLSTILLCAFLGVLFEYSIGMQECLDIMQVKYADTGYCFPFALLLMHSCIFFCSVASHSSANNVAGLLLFPVLPTISMPAMAPVFVFTETADLLGAMTFLLVISMVYFVILIMTGYFLYTKRIMRGLPVVKPLIYLTAAVILLPCITYGITYGWTVVELNIAQSNAKKAGLALNLPKYDKTLPKNSKNITSQVASFTNSLKRWKKRVDTSKTHYFFNSVDQYLFFITKGKINSPTDLKYYIKISPQLYADEEMTRLCNRARKLAAIKNAVISLSNDSDITFQHQYDLYYMINFLSLRNKACYYSGNTEEILSNTQAALHLLKLMPSGGFGWQQYTSLVTIMRNTVLYGKFTSRWNEFRKELLAYINKFDTTGKHNNYSLIILFWNEDPRSMVSGCLNKVDVRYSVPNAGRDINFVQYALALPRTMNFIAKHLMIQTEIQLLYNKALKTPYYKDVKTNYEALVMKYSTHSHFYTKVNEYYGTCNMVNFNKIILALLIYRSQNGSFPERVAQLAPKILEKVPVSAFTGKPYGYKRNGKGFVLSSATIPSLSGKKSDMVLNYQPPAPVGKGDKHE